MPLFFAALPLFIPQQPLAERTVAITTPAGVFYRNDAAGTPSAHRTPPLLPVTAPGLRWTEYDNGLSWICRSVGISDDGQSAWLGKYLNNEELTLSGIRDFSAVQPVWADVDPGLLYTSVWQNVDGARGGDGAIVGVWQQQLGTAGPPPFAEIRLYRRGSSTPVAAYQPNAPWDDQLPDVGISRDGSLAVAGMGVYGGSLSTSDIWVFEPLSSSPGIPILQFSVPGSSSLRELDLSEDGTRLLVASGNTVTVADTATGAALHSYGTVGIDAHAIDYDGDTAVRGGFDVEAWRETSSGSWTKILDWTTAETPVGIWVYDAIDVSPDGMTMVVTGRMSSNSSRVRVWGFDLSGTVSSPAWEWKSDGFGGYQDVPVAVASDAEGNSFAVGFWGDEFNAHEEVMVFDGALGTVLQTLDTPGSVFDLEMSLDGQFIAVGTKAVHANTFGNGGEAYSLDAGGRDLTIRGATALGRTVQFEVDGPTGDFAVLLTGAPMAPLPLSGISGTLEVDPGIMKMIALGPLPAGGLVLPVTVPAGDMSLVGGSTIHCQTLLIAGNLSAASLTNAIPVVFYP